MDLPSRTAEPGPVADLPPAMDYLQHERAYRRFLHIIKWFLIHMLPLLAALYFFVLGGQPVTGIVFLVVAIGLFVYGIVSIPAVARDVDRAFAPAGRER